MAADREDNVPLTGKNEHIFSVIHNYFLLLIATECLQKILQKLNDLNAKMQKLLETSELRDMATTTSLNQIRGIVQRPYALKIKWPLKTVKEFEDLEARFINEPAFQTEIVSCSFIIKIVWFNL